MVTKKKPNPKAKKKLDPQQKLFDLAERKTIRRRVPQTDWARQALNTQGDIILAVIKSITGVPATIEAIRKFAVKSNLDFTDQHIAAGIKNLIEREIIIRDGRFYFVKVHKA